jgi:2-methylisocitrate lyase-like PEP mutase family enzyme
MIMDKASKLRELLASGEMLVTPGCHDPFTARLAEEAGFPVVYLGGYATGADLAVTEPLLQLTEQRDAADNVNRVIDVPLVIDGGAGWGDALHTIRTVHEFERSGIAGFHIEDQVVPKRASYFRDQIHVIPRDEFIQKIRLAVESRENPETLIIGRTDAFSSVDAGGREEAIERGKALFDAGVDLVFFRGVTELADMEYFRNALPDVPQFTTNHGALPVEVYRDLGYRMLVYAEASVQVTYEAVTKLYASIRDRGVTTYEMPAYWAAREGVLLGVLKQEAMFEIERQTVERLEADRPS